MPPSNPAKPQPTNQPWHTDKASEASAEVSRFSFVNLGALRGYRSCFWKNKRPLREQGPCILRELRSKQPKPTASTAPAFPRTSSCNPPSKNCIASLHIASYVELYSRPLAFRRQDLSSSISLLCMNFRPPKILRLRPATSAQVVPVNLCGARNASVHESPPAPLPSKLPHH
jgi:hypothetical protein